MTANIEPIDVAIIGAGVVGCAIAWELIRYRGDLSIFVLEKNPGVTEGENQSSRNSGVIHSGIYYDQKTRPTKARLCVEGNSQLYEFCEKYRVPALKTGKLIVATNEKEESILDLYLQRALSNAVPGVKMVSSAQIGRMEPNIKANAALLVPSAGIVDAPSLVYRLHTLAVKEGARFLTSTCVVDLGYCDDLALLTIAYRDGRIDEIPARLIINAAGAEADQLGRKLDPDLPYELDPVRGESYKFYCHKRPELSLSGMNIYPTPEVVKTSFGRHFTVGIHLTPTFDDLSYPGRIGSTFLVGPKLVAVKDRIEWMNDPLPASIFHDKVRRYFPGLRTEDLIYHQMGLQARLKGQEDFVILSELDKGPAIHLLGIDSPGLTSCLAIGKHVVQIIRETKVI